MRPRFVLIAMRARDAEFFRWPSPGGEKANVGETLIDLMGSRGWPGSERWADGARAIAPTVVGGSVKHGGPDLGPTRAKAKWRELRVDGMGIANDAPGADFSVDGLPRLTVRMVARIQGFPDSWEFAGRETVAYRQVGNAFPPPVARAVGRAIRAAFQQNFSYNERPGEPDLEVRLLEKPPKLKCHPKKAPKA